MCYTNTHTHLKNKENKFLKMLIHLLHDMAKNESCLLLKQNILWSDYYSMNLTILYLELPKVKGKKTKHQLFLSHMHIFHLKYFSVIKLLRKILPRTASK